MTRKKNAPLADFEASLAELENLVTLMDSGELPLEAALKNFEQGVLLARSCQTALQQAEQRVQILVGQGANSVLAAFEPEPE